MIKLGVIGLGRMGGYHASICKTLQSAQLIGISDPQESNWDKIHGASLIKSKDYSEWIDLVDGVIIAVPTAMHYQIAKDCLAKGKHVLIEKPLTPTIDLARELLDLATQHKKALHVGHVERFNGAIQELKKIIDTPLLIESHRMGPFAPRVQKDSVVLDLMIHDLDIILNLVNSPVKTIEAQGTKIYTDSCDIASAQLTFESGTVASIVSSRASQIKQRSMSVHQKNEYMHLDFTTQDLSIYRHASSSVQVGQDQLKYKQDTNIERLFVYKDNPLKLEIENFITSIKTDDNLVSAKQDLSALEVTFEIERLLGLR